MVFSHIGVLMLGKAEGDDEALQELQEQNCLLLPTEQTSEVRLERM